MPTNIEIELDVADMVTVDTYKFRLRKTYKHTVAVEIAANDVILIYLSFSNALKLLLSKYSCLKQTLLSVWSSVSNSFSQLDADNILYLLLQDQGDDISDSVSQFIAPGGDIIFLSSVEKISIPYYIITGVLVDSYGPFTVDSKICWQTKILELTEVDEYFYIEIDLVIENTLSELLTDLNDLENTLGIKINRTNKY